MSGESKPAEFVTLQNEMRKYATSLREARPLLYSTGLRSLDDVLGGGYQPGEVVVIAASTSQGKTMVGLQLAWEISRIGRNVLIISEEMTPQVLAERSIGTASNVEQEDWRIYYDRVFDDVIAWEDSHPGKMMVPSVPCHTLVRTLDSVSQAVTHFKVKAVVVDYIQLISAPGGNRYEQVTNVSIAMKQIAAEYNVSVIALAQFNKSAESEEMPAMHHIADSSQIPKDADVVLLCKWPWFVNNKFENKNEYWIKCAKNRNRGVRKGGAIKCHFDPVRQVLTDDSGQQQEIQYSEEMSDSERFR